MLLSALAMVALLALGPRSVFSRFNSVTFSSVQQCGSFDIRFTGGKPPASLPLTLTVVPFNSTPVSIMIPNFTWNASTATGAAVTFLPFPADTQFVASLDDLYGFPTGDVSDITRVQDSDDTSCLPNNSTVAPARYTIVDEKEMAQCESFDVTFDPTVVDVPPIVRGFVPKGDSFFMNRTSTALGNVTYTLSAPSGSSVVLLFSDDRGFKQTTSPIPVNGSPSDNSSCLVATNLEKNVTTAPAKPSKLSKGAVIAIGVVSGSVVGGIALAMALWLYYHRRRGPVTSLESAHRSPNEYGGDAREKVHSSSYADATPTVIETMTRGLPSIPQKLGENARIVQNPPYTDDQLDNISPTSTQFRAQPPSSSPDPAMLQPISSIPIPTQTPPPLGLTPTPEPRSVPERTPSTGRRHSRSDSLCSDDIEHILEMATMYNPGGTNRPRPSTEHLDTLTLASTLQSATGLSTFETDVPALPTPLPSNPTTPYARREVTDRDALNAYPSLPQSATNSNIPASQVAGPSRISISSPIPRLSPDSMTYRNPPQAPMPSSPLSEITMYSRPYPDDMSSLRGRSFDNRRSSKTPRVLPLELTHSRRPTVSSIDSIPGVVKIPRR
ncbi:hypothetical protein QCA50_006914 [Cerrena zonata]|uniref:Uncharacterized protein n=1 Tax=Cerrena zonata TaxID=2478898 RepID=A0AAW0GG94_9APHY